ncbi:MAG: carbon storage regulator [Planctomycetaceae bacterium]
MLVLTRKENETIQIGDSIVIKVIQTGRGKCKIGIEAPGHIRVMRGELGAIVETLVDRQRSERIVEVEQGCPVAH